MRLVGDMSVSHEGAVKKSRNSSFANGEDCISSLPESIISRILSSLPTEDAVRTCVLSKDWEFKWTSIYHIEIEDSFRRVLNKAYFVKYVDRILLLSHDIRSFHLQLCDEYDSNRVIGWISAVLRRNVEKFALNCLTWKGLLLPRSLLNCTSLTSLRLMVPFSSCTFKVPSENCFPNLLNLYFQGVEIRNELSNTDTLTFTFPVLETMDLRECKWSNVKFVEIIAPALTKFICRTSTDVQVDYNSLNIVGHRLTDLEFVRLLPQNLCLTGSSVTRVDLSLFSSESGLQVRKLLNGFHCLEDLELSNGIAKAIARSEQGLALPRYIKLQRLSLDGYTSIEALLKLLHAAPSLKSLVVHLFLKSAPPNDNDDEAVESLPYCLLKHLEEVEFTYIGFPSSYDFRLEKFLLKNGLRLKTFHLRDHRRRKPEILKILEYLVTFPESSDCLTFVIH